MRCALACLLAVGILFSPVAARAEGDWEITSESEEALARGLEWLAQNQGPEGNWGSNDLGLVAMGALAFLADGHMPGRGKYGENVERALNYIMANAQPNGLLNIAGEQRDMYNHGLATFVLGQAYGMGNDARLQTTLDRALKLIAQTQCGDGGWHYHARRYPQGHDLSLAVMQAKALRSAVDSGLEVPPEVIDLAIRSVREHYSPQGAPHNAPEEQQRRHPGQFTYSRGGSGTTVAMAACGVVCMQEFGQYDDWRIGKSMEVVTKQIRDFPQDINQRRMVIDPYALYYVSQALYQVGGDDWKNHYPRLRDMVIKTQIVQPGNPRAHGMWEATGHVHGQPGQLYATAAACFTLAIPNRYLPILQEGKIESLKRGKMGE